MKLLINSSDLAPEKSLHNIIKEYSWNKCSTYTYNLEVSFSSEVDESAEIDESAEVDESTEVDESADEFKEFFLHGCVG